MCLLEQWESTRSRVAAPALARRVPDGLHGVAWVSMSGANVLEAKNQGVYTKLLGQKGSAECEENIQKDISRTLPREEFFHAGQAGRASLFNVLKAYSVLNPGLGYCQGMSFLAAHVLLFVQEEHAFWLLVQLMDTHKLAGFFLDDVPLLSLSLYWLDRLIELQLPKLFSHFKSLSVCNFFYS